MIHIGSGKEIELTIENLTVAGAEVEAGIRVVGRVKVTLSYSVVSSNGFAGLRVFDEAQVNLTNSQVSNNLHGGLFVGDSATVSLQSSQVSDNDLGLWVESSATVSLTNSPISDNAYDGLVVGNGATAEVRSSIIEGNGNHSDCQQPGPESRKICNGIKMWGKSQVTIDDKAVIEGNNRSGNPQGNPGWPGRPLPDGQVCLP